jgi:amidase
VAELHDLSALEQAAAIRTGQTSPAALVSHYLDRIGALNGQLGAFITVTADQAVDAAREATQRLAHSESGDLPPLFGVPTAIKDLTDTAGIRTTYGSRVFAEHVPRADAEVVTRLRAAGTISLGKTNTPEFGMTPYTDNDLIGPARTPWDLRRSAGGSSGGTAAAVAGGLIPSGHGSDGGGSIRIPAASCGLVGLKPSRGRVSFAPGSNTSGLSVNGPLARTVRDAAALLDAMAGPADGDPWWAAPLPAGETFLGAADVPPGRLRIGRYAVPVSGMAIDPACLAAWEDASALLASLGHEVEDIEAPFDPEISRHFITVWAVISLDHDIADEDLLRPVTRAWRGYGRPITGAAYAAALSGMQLATRRAITATAAFDAVLTPTLAMLPQPVEYWAEPDDPAENLRSQTGMSAFTTVYNMTGQPVVSLPLHWTPEGLPAGVSLAGRPSGEAQLISLAAQLEAARPWADRRPPCW